MPTTKPVHVKDLSLDLKNYRTVPQRTEISSIHAIIAINPDWFWALMDSLLADGYLPTENIIVLKVAKQLVVKEGNRRVGALKLIQGRVPRSKFALPAHIAQKIDAITPEWLSENAEVPCAIYESTEAELVDRIVTLTHGKGEKAGRDKWNAVAKARHNRDQGGVSEPALDLLEKYLKHGKNLSQLQSERWSGVYPLSVLEEAAKRLAPRFGVGSSRELATAYPNTIKRRAALEDVIRDIGLETLDFELIRDKQTDFAEQTYGIPSVKPPATGAKTGGTPTVGASIPTRPPPVAPSAAVGAKSGPSAVPLNDPRYVLRALRRFRPRGQNRNKVVTLVEEARSLKLHKHPHAFCFLLRSMFEISAKAYCDDHASKGGPTAVKANGDDRTLVDVLRDVTTHLTKNNTDKQMKRTLHGAITELARPEGILSVTSMNQLVHNSRFSIDERHIAALFGNIFPLLEEMNR